MATVENKLDGGRQKYYVYEQWLDDKCLWVGFGSNNRKNVFYQKGEKYEKLVKGRQNEIEVIVIKDGMKKKDAMNLEVIQTTKRLNEGYDLCNMVVGHSGFKGGKHSLEARNKMSLAKKGRKHSDETKIKISLAQKGEGNPMYGEKHSDETRKKTSKALKGKMSGKNHPRAKRVLGTNNLTSEPKVFDSITKAYQFLVESGFDKTQRTLRNYLNKGSYNFKNYTLELTK